jgi:hypothetical protein
VANGASEGRTVTFDALRYVASYGDLIGAFGTDVRKATLHFIASGAAEGRSAGFEAKFYLASNPDVRAQVGADLAAATRHYISEGHAQGRSAGFDAWGYLASHADLRAAFGGDVQAATSHFLSNGFAEGRGITFDALAYVASYADLRAAFGTDTAAATRHFVLNGAAEGRAISFDAQAYLASYEDLRAAFGTDTAAATRHFVLNGAAEGRTADLSGDDQLWGSSLADSLNGGTGNDTLRGAGGDDRLEGASGTDTAWFTGASPQYDIVPAGTGVVRVVDKVGGRDGTDTVSGVEVLRFADRLIGLVMGTDGNDRLTLGTQLERVFLGAGADVIKLPSQAVSTPTNPDKIYGFGSDDKLDLSALIGPAAGGSTPQVIQDSGSLGAVGDNQLRMLTVYDATTQTTRLVIRYDTNPLPGQTQTSDDIQLDFDGNLTTLLVPASLIFTGP